MLFTGVLDNRTHIPPDTDMHHFQCTLSEMATALEYDVHVAFGGPKADLHTKATLLQKLLRALTTQLRLRLTDDDRASTFKQVFRYRKYQCTSSITGVWLDGIGRRPVWLHGLDTEKCIVLNLHHVRTQYEHSIPKGPTQFGRDF